MLSPGYQDLRAAHRGDWLSDSDSEPDSDYYGVDSDSETESSNAPTVSNDDDAEKQLVSSSRRTSRPTTCGVTPWALSICFATWLFVAAITRPVKPYRHISTALPISLLDVFHPPPDICAERERLIHNQWPLPTLLNETFWQEPKDDFKGWAPRVAQGKESKSAKQYKNRKSDWFPDPAPNGFTRWDPHRFEQSFLDRLSDSGAKKKSGKKQDEKKEEAPQEDKCAAALEVKDSFYNPVSDPLKITNLDSDIVQPLKSAIGDGSVKIKHVVFILMESLREELFPIQQGSDIHRFIMESHDEEGRNDINRLVSELTPNIQKITGKPGNFLDVDGNPFAAPEVDWNDQTPEGFGGLNVVGAFSPSSVSTKSIAASHCGVWPMAVEMFEEAETESYQPCIPQIFSLFNQIKKDNDSSDFREHQWHTGFFQAVTDTYDRQKDFDKKLGFDEMVSRARIKKDNRKNPMVKEINYFGYADTQLKSYVNDFIKTATENDQRMFLSTFTSTTHHPWALPEWFESVSYMGSNGKQRMHKDFNKYLNTIRFHDAWMGELMQILDDRGVSNETLVVFAGDHGQAFREDTDVTGTYENGHVSNFRIPITFRHPQLPRYQYEANATTLSILPTILDLMISTGSLNAQDTRIASDIVQDYEGQSLIRPYKNSQNGRRAWNFGVVNSGGGMLTVTSADAPWRLVMPLDKDISYTVTDLKNDPLELSPVSDWSMSGLVSAVENTFGGDAAKWATEAEVVAKWWAVERQRLWRYHSANETESKTDK